MSAILKKIFKKKPGKVLPFPAPDVVPEMPIKQDPEEPAWMVSAKLDLGVAEIPGPENNSRIIQYFRICGYQTVVNEETAWCGVFVGTHLIKAGLKPPGRCAWARNFLKWGQTILLPKYGCVVVSERNAPGGDSHVSFFIRETSDKVYVLNGNVKNKVMYSWIDKRVVLGYRWPVSQ